MSMKTLATDQWFAASGSNRAVKLRLFCFPYAGGKAAIYRKWHRLLPETVELLAFQLPGHGTRMRESLCTSVQPLVHEIAAVFPRYFDKPFAIFGHSLGALVGFELARHLRNSHGVEPLRLFVSGRRAAQLPRIDDFTYTLPDDEFIEELRRLNGTPEDVLRHPELMQLMIPAIRADFQMSQAYEYEAQAPLNCPITAIGGVKDLDVTREDLLAWKEQTSTEFDLRMLPGDHFFLHENEQDLLRLLSVSLHDLASGI